jgi:hypothetical protein
LALGISSTKVAGVNMKRFFVGNLLAILTVTSYGQCVDPRGIPAVELPNYQLNDIAQANILPNGAPVIFFNPNVLASTSPPTRLFFQVHECAHHVLGHTLGRLAPNMEQEADCWAIRTIVSRGMIDQTGLRLIQSDIANFGRGDWSHLPGPQRAINLQACLQ